MTESPVIGSFVLESLTTGMYRDPMDTLREFVQNAADSIRHAEEGKLIREAEGRIEIHLDLKNRNLTVRDNGLGIRSADAYHSLVDIGVSAKSIDTDAGFRGIGRLAGIAYCKTLRFVTSAHGEPSTSIVEIDCEALKEAISPTTRKREELASVLANNTVLKHERAREREHYFEVVMEGLVESAADFLDWRKVEGYLQQVSPVDFDGPRHFIFASKIAEYMTNNGLSLPMVTLVIKTSDGVQRQVLKPYRGRYKPHAGDLKIVIKDVAFYPETLGENPRFWLWYSKSDLIGGIDDDLAAGMRLRKHNIALGGPDRVAEMFGEVAESNKRFNAYYIGEIHILSPEAVPNARRDGFEGNDEWLEIRKELDPFIRERCEEVRRASTTRNQPLQKVAYRANALIEEAQNNLSVGLASEKERQHWLDKITREEAKAKLALGARKDPSEAKALVPIVKALGEVRQSLENDNHFAAKKINSCLDRKQRKVITDILALLHETLDEPNYKKARAAILGKYHSPESNDY